MLDIRTLSDVELEQLGRDIRHLPAKSQKRIYDGLLAAHDCACDQQQQRQGDLLSIAGWHLSKYCEAIGRIAIFGPKNPEQQIQA